MYGPKVPFPLVLCGGSNLFNHCRKIYKYAKKLDISEKVDSCRYNSYLVMNILYVYESIFKGSTGNRIGGPEFIETETSLG